jgi:hypothetical protein
MIVRLISTWHLWQQDRRGRGARPGRSYAPRAEEHEASAPSTTVIGSDASSREYEERHLMATAEAMLRAGHGHREIERALRRMSPNVSSDSCRLDSRASGLWSIRR